MSFSDSGHSPQNSGGRLSSRNETTAANRETDGALLEGVLRQTLTLLGAESPLAAETGSALCQLVARYKGRQFALEPVAVELVSIVLATQFQTLGPSPLCDGVAARVARTLYEDPRSRARLEAFWNRLSEG